MILRSFFEKRSARGLPDPSGGSTPAGIHVTPERSIQIAAVFACVRLLSESVAMLPGAVYRREGDSRTRLDEHPLRGLLTDRPNPEWDAGAFWGLMQAFVDLRGNSYAYLVRDRSGLVREIWPVPPTGVRRVRAADGTIGYTIVLPDETWYAPGFTPGKERTVPGNRVLHFRGMGLGPTGLSPISAARNGVAIAYAAEDYGARFFSQGARPVGVIETDGIVTDEQAERMWARWRRAHSGPANAHRAPAILEGGAKWTATGLSPEDAQFLETRKFQVNEIARLFGVPPHMIADVESTTTWGSGVEQLSIGYVIYGLAPRLGRLERVVKVLLQPDEYFRFNVNALLRGDLKSRYEAYAIGRQWGFKSANDILRTEDEDPIGPEGDIYLQPLNMLPAGTPPEAPPEGPTPPTFPAPPTEEETRKEIAPDRGVEAQGRMRDQRRAQFRATMASFFERQRDRIIDEIEGRAKKKIDWDADLSRRLTPLAIETARDAAAASGYDVDMDAMIPWLTTNARIAAERINGITARRIAEATAIGLVIEAIRDVFAVRIESDAERIAATRTTAAWNAGSSHAAREGGARTKTWLTTSGRPRASHAAMNGETVGVSDLFSNGGRWPGDPSLGVEEVAGCMCVVTFE